MRRDAKRDENEDAIVRALNKVGCVIERLSAKGVPDLMVWSPYDRQIVLLEVKDGTKPPSARKLTPEQERWHDKWCEAPVYVVTSIDEAMRAVGAVQ
jgi:hypothetical protein